MRECSYPVGDCVLAGAEREQCIRDVCKACRNGQAVERLDPIPGLEGDEVWIHPENEYDRNGPYYCRAGRIRERVRT